MITKRTQTCELKFDGGLVIIGKCLSFTFRDFFLWMEIHLVSKLVSK